MDFSLHYGVLIALIEIACISRHHEDYYSTFWTGKKYYRLMIYSLKEISMDL
jgi:hypothetical protein